MIRTRKYRLKLNKQQETKVNEWINTCRYVYNVALEVKQLAYKANKTNLTAYDLQKQITECRAALKFVEDVPSEVLQCVTERLDAAFKKFITGYKTGAGFPKFKGRDFYNSLQFKKVKYLGNNIFKVAKLDPIRIFKDNVPENATFKTCTILKENEKYYLCVQYDVPNYTLEKTGAAVGIDVGIAYFCADSDGNTVQNPNILKQYEKQLRIAQRSLARKKKGSKNRQEAKEKVQKIHAKIKNTRDHFQHQTANKYIQNYDVIAVEDLKVKNMVKNKNLAKGISDASWGSFKQKLKYKADFYGRELIPVAPNYTSQTCNKCGYVDAENRQTQAKFVCLSCGHSENADINAAKNILNKAIK